MPTVLATIFIVFILLFANGILWSRRIPELPIDKGSIIMHLSGSQIIRYLDDHRIPFKIIDGNTVLAEINTNFWSSANNSLCSITFDMITVEQTGSGVVIYNRPIWDSLADNVQYSSMPKYKAVEMFNRKYIDIIVGCSWPN